jgi:hypothetical protein
MLGALGAGLAVALVSQHPDGATGREPTPAPPTAVAG